ncbi:unnamed protein product [Ascophyllum nodosum]
MCEETGGCLISWDGEDTSKHKTLSSRVNDLMAYVHKKSPVVMFRTEDSLHGGPADGDDLDDLDGFDGFTSPQLAEMKKPPAARAGIMLRGGSGIWPIPEPFWVDRSVDVLPPRPEAQPEIWFRKPDPGVTDSGSSAEMLEQLGVTADNYELEWCGDGSRLDVPRAVTWPLFVKESGPTPGAGKPFGYLRFSQTSGKIVMVLLPYNFEELIPLLRLRASTVQATKSPQPPAVGSPWARDFVAYLKGVPTYYLPALQRVLQPFGVLSLIPGENLQAGVGVHHRKMVERLNNLKDLAARHVERADRIERAGRAQDPEHRQQHQDSAGSAVGAGFGNSKSSYANAFQVPVGELLSQWETMRAQLFGAGGATVKGLFAGAPGPSRRSLAPSAHGPRFSIKADAADGDGDDDEGNRRGRSTAEGSSTGMAGLRSPVLWCVAQSLAPARSTQEMSNFMSRMRNVEFPRDPLSDPGPDENMPQGGFQRLMASTTFESPFAKKKLGLNPLGLDEAANESAILDEDVELGDDGHKKNGDREAAGDSASSDGASGESDAGNAASPGEIAAGSSDDSSTSTPSTTPGQSSSVSNQGRGQGTNGEIRRGSSFTRRQLPKLIANRGRRRMRPDANYRDAKEGGISTTWKSSLPPPVPAPSSNGSSIEGGSLLLPPASPALPAPRTPDYSPPRTPDYSPPPSPLTDAADERKIDFSKNLRVPKGFSGSNKREEDLSSDKTIATAADDGDDSADIRDRNATRGEKNGPPFSTPPAPRPPLPKPRPPLPKPRPPLPKPRQPRPPAKPRPPSAPRPPPQKPSPNNAPPPPRHPPQVMPPSLPPNRRTTFAPSPSPATPKRTTSPAPFIPTVSPATFGPGTFSPTRFPTPRLAPITPISIPSFTPTISPLSYTPQNDDRATKSERSERPADDSRRMANREEISVDDESSRKRTRDDAAKEHRALDPPKAINPLNPLNPRDYILPDGWILAFSKREKRDYFFNQRSNATQWHLPEGSRLKYK